MSGRIDELCWEPRFRDPATGEVAVTIGGPHHGFGCACGLPKGHDGAHRCIGDPGAGTTCDNQWAAAVEGGTP